MVGKVFGVICTWLVMFLVGFAHGWLFSDQPCAPMCLSGPSRAYSCTRLATNLPTMCTRMGECVLGGVVSGVFGRKFAFRCLWGSRLWTSTSKIGGFCCQWSIPWTSTSTFEVSGRALPLIHSVIPPENVMSAHGWWRNLNECTWLVEKS